MIRYTVYETVTGKVVKYGVCQEEAFDLQEQEGQTTMIGNPASLDSQYVVDGEFVDRPKNPTTLSGLTLAGMPVPSTVVVDGTAYDVAESTVELAISIEGEYPVIVKSFPHRDAVFTVRAPG